MIKEKKKTKIKIYFCSFEELHGRQCHLHNDAPRFVDKRKRLLLGHLEEVGAEAPVPLVAKGDDPDVVLVALKDVLVIRTDMLPQVPHPARDWKRGSGLHDGIGNRHVCLRV